MYKNGLNEKERGSAIKIAVDINRLGFDFSQVSKIRVALEDPNYTWRTIEGISKETKIDPQNVRGIIAQLDDVIKSSKLSKDGSEIFTTKAKYNKIATPIAKLKNAITNRID